MTLKKIDALNVQMKDIDAEIEQLRSELGMLQHLADDAARDASVSEGYEDRADATMTASDVVRCEKLIEGLERDRRKLLERRGRLIQRLTDL